MAHQMMSHGSFAQASTSSTAAPARATTPRPADNTIQAPALPSPSPPPDFNMAAWETDCGLTDDKKEKFVGLGYEGQPLSTISVADVVNDGQFGFKLLRWQRLVRADKKHREDHFY